MEIERDDRCGVRVWLCRASIPGVLGWIAVHYWFVVVEGENLRRWEVWQDRNVGGRSWGHVHCDLKGPEADVGGGPMVVEREWDGAEARRIVAVLDGPEQYPHRQRYRAWPGPNSNTYVAWVLRQAGIGHALGWKGIGKSYGRGKF